MAAIEPGRVCVKLTGRDAGSKCVITKVLDSNFVEVRTAMRGGKARKVNIHHLEPLAQTVNAGNDAEVKAAIGFAEKRQLGAAKPPTHKAQAKAPVKA